MPIWNKAKPNSKEANRFALIFVLFLSACSAYGLIDSIESKLFIQNEQFKYTEAYISIYQPAVTTALFTTDGRNETLKETLRKKGYNVGSTPVSLKESRALNSGTSLLIECFYPSDGPIFRQNGETVLIVNCDALDLYDGSKIYESRVGVAADFSSGFDFMSDNAIRTALQDLPIASEGLGREMSDSEVSRKLRNY